MGHLKEAVKEITPHRVRLQDIAHSRRGRRKASGKAEVYPLNMEEYLVLQSKTKRFFDTGPAFTYGEMGLDAAGKLIDDFNSLSREAKKIPLTPAQTSRLLPEEQQSKDFLIAHDLWDPSMDKDEEGRQLVRVLYPGTFIQKYVLYTGYFYLLAKECDKKTADGENQQEMYAEIFKQGIQLMHADIMNPLKGVLPPNFRETLSYVKAHPREVFLEKLRTLAEKRNTRETPDK